MTNMLTRLSFVIALFVLTFSPNAVLAQQNGTVSGTITVEDEGSALPGANVIALDASGAVKGGTASGLDGSYSFMVAPGSYTLRARYVGFQDCESEVTVSAGATVTFDCALGQSGLELNIIVVAASRREEKALDAPAAISVLSGADLTASVSTSPVEALRTTPGVDMQQTGVDRREMVLRGFNNAFSSAAYVLTDYRQGAVPSLAVNLYSLMPNVGIDIDRVEVVRGPGSALYGAGVDAGVVHFISKDPFTHPGTTVSITGGEQSLFGAEWRHAGVAGPDGKLGYKITGFYTKADDWALDPDDDADALQILADGVRDTDYEKLNVNGALEYRFSETGSIAVNAGYATLKATVLSGIGTVQADGIGYTYGQLRLNIDNFFAQVYLNKNDAADSFVYGAGAVVDKSTQLVAQAQYDMSLSEGKHDVIFGVDLELTRPDTEGTIQTDEGIDEVGGYVQVTSSLTSMLNFTAALRGDYNSVQENFQLSPRAALVYKPNNTSSFRVTYNRAFSSPSTNSSFLNIIAGQIPGTDILIRGRGDAYGYTFERNSAYTAFAGTDLVASSLNPAALGVAQPIGLPLDATYAAVHAGLAAIPLDVLAGILQSQGIPVDAATAGALVFLLSPDGGTNVQGFSRGVLATLNLSTFGVDLISGVGDIRPLDQTITNTYEVGYKGVINDKLLATVDVYYTQRDNFIGPLLVETPFVLVPNLTNDLTAALGVGITGNPQLAGTLALFGVSPEAAANLIMGLAASGLPSASTPVAIVQPRENNAGVGSTPELMLTYRNFGKVSYYGADIAFQYLASDRFSMFGNLSLVSDDFFDNEELGEDDPARELALNAPALKGSAGFRYTMESGLTFNAAGRYTDGFPVRSGPYAGDVDSYFLLDVGVGYDLGDVAPGLRIDFSVSNVLDKFHREFVGAPEMGRMGMGRLTYTIK